jgi:tyrosinase-like protein/polyphenol oxidase-like protein
MSSDCVAWFSEGANIDNQDIPVFARLALLEAITSIRSFQELTNDLAPSSWSFAPNSSMSMPAAANWSSTASQSPPSADIISLISPGPRTGDMGTFDTAARYPIFYAHHSNLDKMWSDWNKASSTHTNPTDASFLNLIWNFYDENKVWRSMTAAQVLNHENQLRYVYGPFHRHLPEPASCLTRE